MNAAKAMKEETPRRARRLAGRRAVVLAASVAIGWLGPAATRAGQPIATKAGEARQPALPFSKMAEVVDSSLAFLARSQNPDGSVGTVQQHLQTALAILAFLSSGRTPDSDARSPIPAACKWLLAYGGEDGFLGDAEFPMESHAVCALALSELRGMVSDPNQAARLAGRAARALDYALAAQDKAVGADFYGGWKADAKKKVNDRRVTAWYLLLLKSASLRGARIPPGSLSRALMFMEGSQKVPGAAKAYEKTDVGGFSYDATGLPVVSITGAGLATMGLYGRDVKRRDLALAWLNDNRPIWYGPNFYYTHFFTARALAREARRAAAPLRQNRQYAQRIWDMLRDHQNPDASFQIPPGNAENTKRMGKTYATAMAVLILNAQRQLLPMDTTE